MSAADFDYIVVGGGTTGVIVAARLAEDAALQVALVEAGPAATTDARVADLRRWPELLGTELDFDYAIEPQARGNSRIRHSRGRMLGGCSSHNSCIAFRPPASDLHRWEQLGASGWGPQGTAPAFDRVYGAVHVAPSASENPLNAAFLEACCQAGIPAVDFAEPLQGDGCGLFQLNARGTERQSSAVAYLHARTHLPQNLTLLTDTTVSRVLLNANGRATGVDTDRGILSCRCEVILACGVFDSPKLLLLSGIGPARQLESLDIAVRLDLPAVGEHLLDHPEGVVMWDSRQPVPSQTTQFWEAGLFAHSGCDADPSPDLMAHFGTVPFDMNTASLGYPTSEHAFSITPNVARARSEGVVQLRSTDPGEPPRIDFRYFTDDGGYDEQVLVAGLQLARRLAAQPALERWVERELAPGADVTGDRELSAYGRATANTVYHPAGTCRMGADADGDAVVDPELRVRGITGLRVADASIFPAMITVNPCITCMMIGEKCAQLIGDSRD